MTDYADDLEPDRREADGKLRAELIAAGIIVPGPGYFVPPRIAVSGPVFTIDEPDERAKVDAGGQ